MSTPAAHGALLAAVADALNACEQSGLAVSPDHGAVLTQAGYVLYIGGSWVPRLRSRADFPPDEKEIPHG